MYSIQVLVFNLIFHRGCHTPPPRKYYFRGGRMTTSLEIHTKSPGQPPQRAEGGQMTRGQPEGRPATQGARVPNRGQRAPKWPEDNQRGGGEEATNQRVALWAKDGQRSGYRAEGPRAKSQRQRPEGGSRRPEGGQMTRGQPEGWGEEGQRPEGQMQHFFKRTLKHFERAPAQRRGRAVPSHANLQRTVRPPDLRK